MSKNIKSNIVDHIFWITFIIFTNPGAILEALGEDSNTGGVNVTDILFVVLFFCFITAYSKNNNYSDKGLSKIIKYLFIFLFYYVVVFAFFIPLFKNNALYDPINTLLKIRFGFMNIILVLMVYRFYLRSYMLFFRYLILSSILIMVLFLITVLTGVDILPVSTSERGFIDIERLIMKSYGLLPFLLPMGIVLLVFKFKIKYRKFILIGALLMYILWLLSLYRRYIFGTIILFVLTTVVYNYICQKSLLPIKKLLSTMIYLLGILMIIYFSFPKYVDAGIEAGKQTIYIIQYGKTISGDKDARMGFGKGFMQKTIKNNWVFGTGFDNRWRTGKGDKSGFEATDYPFLSAIAMTGIFGLLFFLPIYVVLIRLLLYDIKFIRRNYFNIKSFEDFIIMAFIIYFIYDLLQYMNWFLPVSLFSITAGKNWYIFLALYLASRSVFYNIKMQEKHKNKSKSNFFELTY